MTTKKEIIEAVERLQKALLDEYELLKDKEAVDRQLKGKHYEVLEAKENLRTLDY